MTLIMRQRELFIHLSDLAGEATNQWTLAQFGLVPGIATQEFLLTMGWQIGLSRILDLAR